MRRTAKHLFRHQSYFVFADRASTKIRKGRICNGPISLYKALNLEGCFVASFGELSTGNPTRLSLRKIGGPALGSYHRRGICPVA